MIVRADLAVGIRAYRTGITGALLCLCSFEQPTARQQGAGFFMDVCMNYPNKDSHFAHRTIRLMHKASVASVIGRDAFCLVTVILHTEDAARYRGPVNFYNSQLMETLGFSKWDSFNRARQRAIDSGWLVYEGDGKRSPGRYFVTIPHGYGMIDDGVIEGIIPESGYNQGYNDGYKAGVIEGIKRGQSGVQTGVTSYPIPNPNPNPIKERSAEPPELTKSTKTKTPGIKTEVDRPESVDPQAWADWRAARKGAKITKSVMDRIEKEAAKARIPLGEAIRFAASKSWRSFEADWYWNAIGKQGPASKVYKPLGGDATYGT